jgi:hypothetical protein
MVTIEKLGDGLLFDVANLRNGASFQMPLIGLKQ